MLLESTASGKRCLGYIEQAATELGVKYDLTESHANHQLLCSLWDACLAFDAGSEAYTPDIMQQLCDALLEASICTSLGGVTHREPLDLSEYELLFNTPMMRLGLEDVPYAPPKPVQLQITWELEADDDSVKKLTPGAQLKLW